jgi:ABC-type transport system involved in cytochrome bd biosynthesis fused ATPase/permease subunit
VVIVTHDSRVLSFGDRIVRIEDGVIASNTEAEMVPPGLLSHNLPQAAIGLV